MILTHENYYSREANEAYWSASFVKSMLSCPAGALAELQGEYERPDNTALLVGSFVDAYFNGKDDFEKFGKEHPEIFNSRTGGLKSDYRMAQEMIERAEQDNVFMQFMEGEKQKILTGEIAGIPFKAKLDIYVPGQRIVDLKTTRDMEPVYKPGEGRLSFADYWNWPLQMAVYQWLEGNMLPCYLAVITKQNPPDIAVIEVPQHVLDAEMVILREKLPYFDAMRQGIIEPDRCGKCAFCRETKKLTGTISLDELTEL